MARRLCRFRPAVCALLVALAAAFGGTALAGERRTAASASGGFTLHIAGLGDPEPLNHMHGLDLVLTGKNGQPIAGADIVLTGQRHYSKTPLPTLPQTMPQASPGLYRVEGVRFHMPGDWRLAFDISFAHIHDRAVLDVVVK
jgi:hypothetical protein